MVVGTAVVVGTVQVVGTAEPAMLQPSLEALDSLSHLVPPDLQQA